MHLPLFEPAYHSLVTTHLWLAQTEATRFLTQGRSAGYDFDELVAQAYLHLVEAALAYQSREGTPFTAYARLCVRRGLHRHCRTSGLIRISHHLHGEELQAAWDRTKVSHEIPFGLTDDPESDPALLAAEADEEDHERREQESRRREEHGLRRLLNLHDRQRHRRVKRMRKGGR